MNIDKTNETAKCAMFCYILARVNKHKGNRH